MKACVLENIGKLNINEVEMPSVSENEVLIAVKAAGICGSDIPRAYKTGAYSHPLIIGHEFSGEVVKDSGLGLIGRRVGVFPLIPCMSCEMCKNKQYEMCKSYGYIGSRQDGAFAEYVKVPEWNLIELPDNVSYKQAAMLEPLSVAIHAVRRSGLLLYDDNMAFRHEISNDDMYSESVNGALKLCRQDAGIAVIGLGTIGLLLAMVLKNAGYENIYVIGNKELQWQKAAEIGISEAGYFDNGANVRSNNPSVLNEWLQDKNINVFFECVGSRGSINTAIDNTSLNGTVVLVGNPAGDITIEKQIYWKILRKQLKMTGTWNSSFTHSELDDWHYAVKAINNGSLHPENLITHEYPLENIITGFELMRDKKEEYVKVMAVM